MQKNNDWIKIARYVSGNSSPEEKKIIEDRMISDEVFRHKVEEARRAWGSSNTQTGRWDTDKAWHAIQKKLKGIDRIEPAKKTYAINEKKKRKSVFSFTTMARAAAVILIAAITGIIYYQTTVNSSNMQAQEQKGKELVTQKGEQKSFQLSDGTNITLAADSKVRLSPDYRTGEREVYLSGEAFFDVAANPDRPFRVHVNETITEVLGTQFNVISYPQDQTVQVVVVEGSVGLRATKINEEILLKPGELGSFTLGKKLSVRKVDVRTYVGWREGKLIFEDETLRTISTRFERWYDLSFIIEDPGINQRKLTATFARRQSLTEVLDALALSLDISYTKNDSTVIFHKKP